MPKPKTCESCKWFLREGDTPKRGECKRRSPEPFDGDAKWQIVFVHTPACGDFQKGAYNGR